MSNSYSNNSCALHPQHLKLINDSAICTEVSIARGYRTVEKKSELKALGFSSNQCNVPALLVPIWNVRGEKANYQIRPDEPRINKSGKPVKYETPSKAQMLLDVHPFIKDAIGDPRKPLFITEGIRKADAAISAGLCCIALLGVWNWRGSNEHGGKVALPDWEYVALKGRKVYICFDSDVMLKPSVHGAMVRLKSFLEQRGAEVYMIYLPQGNNDSKNGLDDYLADNHTADDLLKLAKSELIPISDMTAIRNEVPYISTPKGLIWRRSTADGETLQQLTNFQASIVSEVIRDDGVDISRYFEIQASLDGKEGIFAVTTSQFVAMNWHIENLGSRAVIYPGTSIKEHAKVAIQLLSQESAEKYIYTHTGWRCIDGTWCYLSSGGAIGESGYCDAINVELQASLSLYILPTPPENDDLKKAVNSSLAILEVAPDGVMIPLYSAIWLAAVSSPDFAIHLVGPTGSGKSELAALVQQHWGATLDSRHLPGSWSSTANALEALAFQAKNAVLVVDDFAPVGTSSDIARMHKDADRLLRAQGNSAGRQRMRADATLASAKYPRCLILSTGEDVPKGESCRARQIILETTPDVLKWDQLSQCQKDAREGLYASAMAGFVRWVASKYDEIQTTVSKESDALREKFTSQSGHKRTPGNIAKLGAGFKLFLKFAQDVGAITSQQADNFWNRAWEALETASDVQTQHQSVSEPAKRFIELLRSAISSGYAHVASSDGDIPAEPIVWGWRKTNSAMSTIDEWHPQGRSIGWIDGTDLYLDRDSAISVAMKMANEQGDAFGVTPRTLIKRLHEQKFLASVDSNRNSNTVRRVLAGSRRQVLHLIADVVMPDIDDHSAHFAHGNTLTDADGQLDGQLEAGELIQLVHDNCPSAADTSTIDEQKGNLGSLGNYQGNGDWGIKV